MTETMDKYDKACADAGFDEPIYFSAPKRLANGGVSITASHPRMNAMVLTVTPEPAGEVMEAGYDVRSWCITHTVLGTHPDNETVWSMPEIHNCTHGGLRRKTLEAGIAYAKEVAQDDLRRRRFFFVEDWLKAD